MRLNFSLLNKGKLEWLRNLRNQNKEWFINNRIIEHEDHVLWFQRSTQTGDLNLVIHDEESGEAVGFLSIYNIYGECANIGRMMIDDKYKHQGYMGRAIIKAFDLAKIYFGIHYLVLEVKNENVIARDLYTKMGFVTYGFTSHTLIMKKIL